MSVVADGRAREDESIVIVVGVRCLPGNFVVLHRQMSKGRYFLT